MNIIQIQDRLKGMPKEAIVDYVQNPTGDVPTFLALAELQRRKDSEAKFQAMQEQPASIAEQLVAENMPMGLAGMSPSSAMTPSTAVAPEGGISNVPSQAMEPSSVLAADSGIATLPTPTPNFAGGGIVAFEEGGDVGYDDEELTGADLAVLAGELAALKYVPNPLIVAYEGMAPGTAYASEKYTPDEFAELVGVQGYDQGGSVLRRLPKVGKYIDAGKKFLKGTGKFLYDPNKPLKPSGKIDEAIYGGIAKTSRGLQKGITGLAKGIYNNPFASSIGGIGLGSYLLSGESDQEKALRELEEANKASMEMHKQARLNRIDVTPDEPEPKPEPVPEVPEKTMTDFAEEFKALMGPDDERDAQRERLAKLDERAERQAKLDPYLALTRAGFAMAAGTSPRALENIAKGGEEGINAYTDALEKQQAAEAQRFELQSRLAEADRAEKVAMIQYGQNSLQHQETMKLKRDLAQLAADTDLATTAATLNAKAIINQSAKAADRVKARKQAQEEWEDYAEDAFNARFENEHGDKNIGGDFYNTQVELWLQSRMNEILYPQEFEVIAEE